MEENVLHEKHSGGGPPWVIHIFGLWVPQVIPWHQYLVTFRHPHGLTSTLCSHIWIFWVFVGRCGVHGQGCVCWHAPNLFDKPQRELEIENNRKVRSSKHVSWLSTLWKGRGAFWNSKMGLGRIDKLQPLTRAYTKPTQSG